MTLAQDVSAAFAARFGHAPDGVAFAPGRVNLIGEHVDYNQGLVLPMPIAAGTAVAWSRSDRAETEAVALDFGLAEDRLDPAAPGAATPGDWRCYLRGMTAELAACGVTPGPLKLAIAGSIPRGSGLSSSASLCIALGRALAEAARGTRPAPQELALAAQAAEHAWAGVHCGIMDQMAIAAGEPGAALLLDCRDLTTQSIALPDDWAVMIVQSGVVRGLVDGHYNARRADCEAAARALGLASLRDATAAQVRIAALSERERARALHVVEEMARVGEAVTAIRQQDLPALGELLRASHASLRDLFEVSVPPVDRLVDLLNAEIGRMGGARMTGGGFGGAVVAVLPATAVARVRATLKSQFRPDDGSALSVMIERTGGQPAGATA